MTNKEWEEKKYFNLFTAMTMLDVYLKKGGSDIEHIREIVNETMNQNNAMNGETA